MFRLAVAYAFFSAIFIVVGNILFPVPAQAEDRVLNDKSFEVIGVRIAKSASMQLADLPENSHALLEQSTYIPAGTPMLLLKHPAKDRKGRGLTLAITSSGLLVYVRTDGVHYFANEGIDLLTQENAAIAIAQSKLEVNTENYGVITITPTEIYTFKYAVGDDIEIRIGKEKMGDAYKLDEDVKVNADGFAIIASEQLATNRINNPFQEYDAIKDLKSVIESAASWNLTKEQREKFVQAVQTGRLVNSKACDDEIKISAEANAGAAFDTDVIFSPLKAKLGISGTYTQTTKFPSGTEFTVRRYSRDGKVVEFKQEKIYTDGDCVKPLERQRLTIAEGNGKSAKIDSKTDIGLTLTANFLPQYSCRDEYMKLLDFFIRQESLSHDSAVLAIAQFGRFKSPQNAAACTN